MEFENSKATFILSTNLLRGTYNIVGLLKVGLFSILDSTAIRYEAVSTVKFISLSTPLPLPLTPPRQALHTGLLAFNHPFLLPLEMPLAMECITTQNWGIKITGMLQLSFFLIRRLTTPLSHAFFLSSFYFFLLKGWFQIR